MTVPAFPLQWPHGWPRLAADSRRSARFVKNKRQISIAEAVDRVRSELARMRVSEHDLVISTNIPLRLDGFPRSDRAEPTDPGAAVYWRDSTQDGWPARCMAVDLYDRVADNLAAIAATLDAMRAIERHGGAAILDRAFTGFTALDAPAGPHWSAVLGVATAATFEVAQSAYRRLRSVAHPDKDKDGTSERFHEVQTAWDQFCRERGVVGTV